MAEKKAVLEVRLRPAARTSEIEGFSEGVLRASVKEPPREGRANRALIALVAQALGVPKGNIKIVRGASSRNKVLSVAGLSPEELAGRLTRYGGR